PVDLEDRLRDRLPGHAGGEDALVVLRIALEAGGGAALRVGALVADIRRDRRVLERREQRAEVVTPFDIPAAEAPADGVDGIREQRDVFRRAACPERAERRTAEVRVGVQLGERYAPADALVASGALSLARIAAVDRSAEHRSFERVEVGPADDRQIF